MSGLAFSLDRDGTSDPGTALRALAAAAPHRSPGGLRNASTSRAHAGALIGSGASRAAVATSHDDGILVAADARLDNHHDLARQLAIDPASSNAELILAAYRRWNLDAPARFIGDFAFALWDASREQLVAARDPFGMRPLHYRIEPSRILVASEVAQILAVPGVPRTVHEAALLGSLAGVTRPDWTYHQGILRLPPGHLLRITRSTSQTARFWPPPIPPSNDPPDQLAAQLRQLLARSTGDRIEREPAPALLLSGGIDSTSIAALSGDLHRQRPASPLLRTYSFAYTTTPEADERTTSDLVAATAGLPNVAVPTEGTWPLADGPDGGPSAGSPFLLLSHLLLDRAARTAAQQGVTSIISGHRGDALLGRGIYDYLGRLTSQGPRTTWRELTAHHHRTGIPRRTLTQHYLLRPLPAAIWPPDRAPRLRALLRPLLTLRRRDLPAWLHPDAFHRLGLHELPTAPVVPPSLRGHGHGHPARYAAILDDNDMRAAEAFELTVAHAGLEYADPWADRRIAELILSIPPHRTSRGGNEKWLTHQAIRGLVPEPALTNPHPATPEAFYRHGLLDEGRETVRALLKQPLTADLGLIDATRLLETYEGMVARDPLALRHFNLVWRVLNIERWLRHSHT